MIVSMRFFLLAHELCKGHNEGRLNTSTVWRPRPKASIQATKTTTLDYYY
jgi:hypothetical protein